MRRLGMAALSAVAVMVMSAGAALAAPPTITRVDFSQFEPFAEADWAVACGWAVDVEFEGHIVFHEFGGDRLVAVNNWRTFQSYTANGKTITVAVNGPDHLWIAGDGTLYKAITGRSPSDGMIGRMVLNDGTGAVVGRHGRTIDNPFDDLCIVLGP